MIELYSPDHESELLVLRSVLDASGIRYFVKNDLFGSLTVGPRIDHYNRKTIYVHQEDLDLARPLLAEFLAKTEAGAPPEPPSGRDVLRMLTELLLFGWFMPGRRRRPSPPPELHLIDGDAPARASNDGSEGDTGRPCHLHLVQGRRPGDDEL